MNLRQIAEGWKNLVLPTEQSRELFEERVKICDTCPSKLQINSLGAHILRLVNDEANTYYCKECMCPLATSLPVPGKRCKLNKWPIHQT